MRKPASGFAVLGILIVVVVVLSSTTGWYVLKSKNKTQENLNKADISELTSTKDQKTNAEAAEKKSDTNQATLDSEHKILADVNGDGSDDKIVFIPSSGEWRVSLSTESGFDAAVKWIGNHGIGSSKQFVADVTGDGKADAVVFFARVGEWRVAASSGISFTNTTGEDTVYNPNLWIRGFGVGSVDQLLQDINGDQRADAVVEFSDGSQWAIGSPETSLWQEYRTLPLNSELQGPAAKIK